MKNWMKRALRTALQSAIGYAVAALPAVDWTQDNAAIRAALVGIGVTAISAGIAAVMNLEEDYY